MIGDIVRATNVQAEHKNDSFRMNCVDLLAFIGCLYSRGLFSSGIAVGNCGLGTMDIQFLKDFLLKTNLKPL